MGKNLIFLIATVLQDDVHHMSRRFLKEGGPKNAETAFKVLFYAEPILITLQIMRVLLMLASFKWTWLSKATFYLETMIQVTGMVMPLDVPLPRETTYHQMLMYMTFWLSYFNLWTDLSISILSLIPVYVSQAYYLDKEPVPLLINYLLSIPPFALNLLFVHFVITKLGFLYVDNAVIRSGNE